MSNSDAVYLTNAQDTPTSQTEPRDYILIIIGLISSAACLAMILSDLRRMCCGCLKKKKEEQESKRPSIIVELSVGSIVLVWWVAMITYTLTSYDGFPRCAMTGPKDVTGKVYSGCHLMDGALGADFVETYDCYSPTEYDRRPSTEIDEFWQPTSISPVVERDEIDEEADPAYVKLVEKNTKINQKVGHHSMAVLISYRSIR
ncbi:hypothetical protein BC943DRAFT_355922 [Umbelopsis sp. AD052]|nr:hypothetical protein BC943DRAFT_355922 [Umbelopsis sp. AD052]